MVASADSDFSYFIRRINNPYARFGTCAVYLCYFLNKNTRLFYFTGNFNCVLFENVLVLFA